MKHCKITSEEQYGAEMAALVAKERKKEVKTNGRPNTMQQRIARLMADGRERTTQDVVNAFGFTERSQVNGTRNALTAMRDDGRLTSTFFRDGVAGLMFWQAARVTTSDRIAAAKREAK